MKNEIEKLWDFDRIKNCSLVGYIECTKHELEDKFGKNGLAINREEDGYDDPKVQNEWWVRINETNMTIYDYKEERPIADDDKIIWHVGSKGIQALFELMAVGFEPAQVLTREEFYNKRFSNFA
tara:strand:+ start:715 stop:1086 length:372 start_codon:yes stop_codon:yes gene_type:complete